MALSGQGISFGDFHDIGAEEYETLFGDLKNPLHNSYLELPWNEEDYVHDASASTMQGLNEYAEDLSQQQQQLLQQQHQQHVTTCLQQQQQQQMDQHIQQQQLYQQQQQHMFQLQQHQQQQQQQQQHALPVSNTPFMSSPTHSSTQALTQPMTNQMIPDYAQGMQQAHLNMSAHNHAMMAQDMATAMQSGAHQHMIMAQVQAQQMALQSLYASQHNLQGHLPAQPPQLPNQTVAQVVADDTSRSSDGQTAETAEANKKRRNKKKRDPSYYANFYDKPEQYSRTETAYYADNESSGSSSGASSEAAAVGGSGGIDMADTQSKSAEPPKEMLKDSQTGNQMFENHMQQTETPSVISNNSEQVAHHAPDRTSPVAAAAEDEKPPISCNDSPASQMPTNPQLQMSHSPTEPSAIPTQAVPTKVKQQVVEYPRTKASADEESVNPFGLSFGLGDSLPIDTKLEALQISSTATDDAKCASPRKPSLEEPSGNNAQCSAEQAPKLDIADDATAVAAAVTPSVPDQAETSKPEEPKPSPVSSPTPAPAQAPAPKPSSWASLFKSPASSTPPPPATITPPVPSESPQVPDTKPVTQPEVDDKTPVPVDKDPRAKELGGALSGVSLNHRAMYILPRGLKNVGNWCYVNSILQALLACPPFYHLMKYLPSYPMQRGPSSSPMLDAIVELVSKFSEPSTRTIPRKGPPDIKPGMAFEPSMVYQMMTVANTSLSVKQGRQEDAEEFLGCLLNGLHEEMLALMKYYTTEKYGDTNGPAGAKTNGLPVSNHTKEDRDEENEDDDNEEEWEQVGRGNKSSITRVAHFNRSPLYDIFGGQMRSALHQQGSKESATLQPFFTLQLDIQSDNIWTVREAIENLGNREALHGFTCNKTKQEVEASRRITLEELPPVLTLHLKRFVYDKSGGCQKVMKKLDYSVELEINRDLLSPNMKSSKMMLNQRTYKLFAVVYHTGKEASGGHYITDVFHAGSSSWLRLDDSMVKPVRLSQVIKPLAAYTPYLLFYRRRDLI